MKKRKFIYSSLVLLGILVYACSDDFLTEKPQGSVSEDQLTNVEGVQLLLLGAYNQADGESVSGTVGNWLYGSVVSDDAYKGSEPTDNAAWIDYERGFMAPTAGNIGTKWNRMYNSVFRCNTILRILSNIEDISESERLQITAEARFLRGFSYFELKKMFVNVPYVDETAEVLEDFNVSNVDEGGDFIDIWPQIEADFQFAADNLPNSQAQVGRPVRRAAVGFLAKAHMYQQEYSEALPLFNEIISSGQFSLNPNFFDSFRTSGNNSAESLWEFQQSVNDGERDSRNGRWGDILQGLQNGPGSCCGFHQPSQNLVNAFETDANGLPLLDSFNETDAFDSDEGLPSFVDWEASADYMQGAIVSRFAPSAPDIEVLYRANSANSGADPLLGGPWEQIWSEDSDVSLDPRLDWTIGRRGIPYLDWGDFPGTAWVRDPSHGGAYVNKKQHYNQAEAGTNTAVGSWSQMPNVKNIKVLRYADVLLMAAECEVEIGSLDRARQLVDQVRARAANELVTEYVDRDNPMGGFTAEPSANYNIGLYSDAAGSADPFTDQARARLAVRYERRLELAMEGHRLFDLRRWNVVDEVMNEYLAVEQTKRTYLQGGMFSSPRTDTFPIPQQFIDGSAVNGEPLLRQNPGY